MMSKLKNLLCSVLFLSTFLNLNGQDFDCFAILAGKNATADGSVLFAHNEDDGGEQMLNMYVVPANPAKGTAKYIWAEFPGQSVADAFMNEYGVAVASDACPSVENNPELADGGVLYEIRVNVAKYAHSAKDAVKIIGKLVEQYGYRSSGRTYTVADCNEGWTVSIVNGKHWVAQRIPDDMVMVIPNNYVIDKVNLADTNNFAGSKDLIEYAQSRGWYDPQRDGEFSFKKAYTSKSAYVSKRNVIRNQKALEYLTRKDYPEDPDKFQFAVRPAKKVTLEDMMNMLSIHNHNSEAARKGNHPHCICYNTTIVSTIFQLKSKLPKDIGCIMWTAAGPPCIEAYVPWHLGMSQAPKGFARFANADEAEAKHFSDAKDLRKNYGSGIYWKFVDRWSRISKDYANLAPVQTKNKLKLQKEIFKIQRKTEKYLMKNIYTTGVMTLQYPSPVERTLNEVTERLYEMVIQ